MLAKCEPWREQSDAATRGCSLRRPGFHARKKDCCGVFSLFLFNRRAAKCGATLGRLPTAPAQERFAPLLQRARASALAHAIGDMYCVQSPPLPPLCSDNPFNSCAVYEGAFQTSRIFEAKAVNLVPRPKTSLGVSRSAPGFSPIPSSFCSSNGHQPTPR